MTSDIKIGISLDKEAKALRYGSFMSRFFDFIIMGCTDISQFIRSVGDKQGSGKLFARLSVPNEYIYNGVRKKYDMAFSLVYDFVDAFVITDFDDFNEDVDPILNLRMYNEEYKPVYLEVKSSLLYEELDDIITYSLMSNIDGLFIQNQRLLKYAIEKSNGILSFISPLPENPQTVTNQDSELFPYFIPACSSFPPFSIFKLWKIRRLLKKSTK